MPVEKAADQLKHLAKWSVWPVEKTENSGIKRKKMASQLPILFLDTDHYLLSFIIFRKMNDQVGKLTNWVESAFSNEVQAKIQVTLADHEELHVLGVGSGDGKTDCAMLEKLLQQFKHINNRVVEPLQEQVDQYKKLAQSKAHELQVVNFDWRQQTIEEYEKAGDLTKFHFISAVHSMYHVDNGIDTLMYLYSRLEPGGVMFVLILSDNSGWLPLREHFSFRDKCQFISSADVRSSLERHDIPYTQYHHTSNFNITKCFDKASEDGSLLLDFITQVLKFKEAASEDLQREVMEYLASSDHSEKKSDGQVLLNNDWDVVVVCKPKE